MPSDHETYWSTVLGEASTPRGLVSAHGLDTLDLPSLLAWLADAEAEAIRVGADWLTGMDLVDLRQRAAMHLMAEVASSHKVPVHPSPPPCDPGCTHDWVTPYRREAGHGRGVLVSESCGVCGCGRHTDTWEDTVTYIPEEYRSNAD